METIGLPQFRGPEADQTFLQRQLWKHNSPPRTPKNKVNPRRRPPPPKEANEEAMTMINDGAGDIGDHEGDDASRRWVM